MKIVAVLSALIAVPFAAHAADRVMCSRDGARPVACMLTIVASRDGNRVLTFVSGGKRVRFAGRSQTGWWSGTLDGKPAMGLELNRGYTRFSTSDLSTTFDWFYPGQQHGTY